MARKSYGLWPKKRHSWRHRDLFGFDGALACFSSVYRLEDEGWWQKFSQNRSLLLKHAVLICSFVFSVSFGCLDLLLCGFQVLWLDSTLRYTVKRDGVTLAADVMADMATNLTTHEERSSNSMSNSGCLCIHVDPCKSNAAGSDSGSCAATSSNNY